MKKDLLYYYFGPQCYGYRYMGRQAEKAAKLLGYDYREYDLTVTKFPQDIRIYFPGNIVVDDLIIVYPGSPEQLAESVKRRGPLTGEHVWEPKPSQEPDRILPLLNHLQCASGICLGLKKQDVAGKYNWLANEAKLTNGQVGMVAFVEDRAVAAVEFIREDRIPYSIPQKRKDFLFITCIYNCPKADKDYRSALLTKTKEYAIINGFKGLSIICGYETPYPNGPVNKLLENNFAVIRDLDKVMLRYKWEPICFMQVTL